MLDPRLMTACSRVENCCLRGQPSRREQAFFQRAESGGSQSVFPRAQPQLGTWEMHKPSESETPGMGRPSNLYSSGPAGDCDALKSENHRSKERWLGRGAGEPREEGASPQSKVGSKDSNVEGLSLRRKASEGNKGGIQKDRTQAQRDARQVPFPVQGPAIASASHVAHP